VSLHDYFAALERLLVGQSTIIPPGTKITNDAVSLEAGRKKGSIKKSRPSHADLIAAIEAASAQQPLTLTDELNAKLNRVKKDFDVYRELYENALDREQSLVAELFEVKRRLSQLTGENIFPFTKLGQNY
jgi:hypothetical protein